MNATPRCTLVTGGAASGKSAFAERLCAQLGQRRLYLATARKHGAEMDAKIARHRARRDASWRTIECDTDLNAVLAQPQDVDSILLDCLTLWLSNVMEDGGDIDAATDGLVAALNRCHVPVVIVTNEVGQGIVPDNALARRFRDAQGILNQRIAVHCDLVVAVMSGLPLVLKGRLPEGLS